MVIKADNDKVSPIRPIGGKAKMRGANSGGVDAVGVLDSRRRPDPGFLALWNSVMVDEAQKQRLLAQAVLCCCVVEPSLAEASDGILRPCERWFAERCPTQVQPNGGGGSRTRKRCHDFCA